MRSHATDGGRRRGRGRGRVRAVAEAGLRGQAGRQQRRVEQMGDVMEFLKKSFTADIKNQEGTIKRFETLEDRMEVHDEQLFQVERKPIQLETSSSILREAGSAVARHESTPPPGTGSRGWRNKSMQRSLDSAVLQQRKKPLRPHPHLDLRPRGCQHLLCRHIMPRSRSLYFGASPATRSRWRQCRLVHPYLDSPPKVYARRACSRALSTPSSATCRRCATWSARHGR